jgi:hypothetical protein
MSFEINENKNDDRYERVKNRDENGIKPDWRYF